MLLRPHHLFNCLKQRRSALAAWIAHRFMTVLTPAEGRLKPATIQRQHLGQGERRRSAVLAVDHL